MTTPSGSASAPAVGSGTAGCQSADVGRTPRGSLATGVGVVGVQDASAGGEGTGHARRRGRCSARPGRCCLYGDARVVAGHGQAEVDQQLLDLLGLRPQVGGGGLLGRVVAVIGQCLG